ncbi:uncharacterized protein LOC122358057 isoform X4 [Puntigrus tetrazona]|uniref:uncharacterized protein LOC122358057 isoform X4 n=1 Tax=Puntigrus tetrazona TaxID=1606681 RepID=UPI001C8AE5C3|nr:uncharacterized protein LOC122358057 isoform X4 [Puntigrus tetrazona]
MMLIFGLMLLLQSAACLDQYCRLNQSDICYAALGHKLSLLMVWDTTKHEIKIQQNINYNTDSDPVCTVKNDMKKKSVCDLYWSRTEVTVNAGTLIINPVIRSDSGNYTIRVYSSGGTEIFKRDLQVKVEAPIGSVEVSIKCSSSGERRASCSSEGDQILYSWTLNGDPLMDGDSFIDLDTRTDGNISCSVKNNVSHGQKTVEVKPCPGSTAASETSTVTNNSSSGKNRSSQHQPPLGMRTSHTLISLIRKRMTRRKQNHSRLLMWNMLPSNIRGRGRREKRRRKKLSTVR